MESYAEGDTNVGATDGASTIVGGAANTDVAAAQEDNIAALSPIANEAISSVTIAEECNEERDFTNFAVIDGPTRTKSTLNSSKQIVNHQAPDEGLTECEATNVQVEVAKGGDIANLSCITSVANDPGKDGELNESSITHRKPINKLVPESILSQIQAEETQESESVVSISDVSKEVVAQNNSSERPGIVEVAPANQQLRKSYLSSLTSQFAPETKAAWAQVFGVRYEPSESIDIELTNKRSSSTEKPVPSAKRTGTSQRVNSPLRDKEPLRARRHSYQDHTCKPQTSDVSDETHKRQNTSRANTHLAKSISSNQFDCDGSSPLELAGLSLTQIRFCHERALDNTCRNFDRIRSDLLREDRPEEARTSKDVETGIFLTQWELEQALRDAQIASGDCDFEASELGSSYADIPIDILLEATWFLPFDQLPRLRTLVLQITRRHLNESRLARLNRHLRHQLLWIPHSTKLQQLIVRFTDDVQEHNGESIQHPISLVKDSPALVRELAECIETLPRLEDPSDAIFASFRTAAPVVLAKKWRLGSVLKLQRLVYFRFFLLAIAYERYKLTTTSEHIMEHRSKRDTLVSAARRKTVMELFQPQNSKPNGKPRSRKRQRKRLISIDGDSDNQETESGSEESDLKSRENTDQKQSPTDKTQPKTPHRELKGGEEESKLHALQSRLENSIGTLEKIFPTITRTSTREEDTFATAKATFVAANAFKQRITSMTENRTSFDGETTAQYQKLVEALESAICEISSLRVMSPKPKIKASVPLPHRSPISRRPSSRYPPPYPESEASLPADDDDTSSKRTYPPPYIKTSPAFWTFQPEIEPPKPSIAKLLSSQLHTAQPGDHATVPSSTPRAAGTKSPGVGSYDIRRSDRLTFPEGPSFSFAPSSCEKSPTPTPKPLSSSKPRVWKSSLAFLPHLPNVEEDRSGFAATEVSSSYLHEELEVPEEPDEADRIDAEAQCDGVDNASSPKNCQGATVGDQIGSTDDISCTVGVNLDEALRFQQRMFVDDFLQTVSARHNKGPGKHRSTTSRHPLSRGKPTPSHAKVHWRGSLDPTDRGPNTSRFVTRLRMSRSAASPTNCNTDGDPSVPPPFDSKPDVRRARPSSGAERPKSAVKKKSPSVLNPTPQVELPSPDGRVEPDAQHQAWAARVGAFYTSRMGQQAS